ncbi:aminotransferase [Defluviimonas sp. SAOS-178_SWC]|uniref:aminotransferase n=1 Tax=Defluviimonas sp. SAOS-178_SWC TaxID=3121287 RepID=UPI003221C47A
MTKLINDFDRVRDWDNAHFLHPWEAMEDHGRNERTFVEAASGIHVRDETGRNLIDGPGGMWCVQIGYGREEMGRAIAEQAVNMAYYSPYSMGHSAAAELAAKIAERTPGDLNKVFFTTGGSTAVDTAIRFLHFRNNVLGKREKKIVISRQKAYHGSSYLSASVSGKERDRNWFDFASDLVHFLPDVNPYRRPEGMTVEAFLDAKVEDLESAILTLGPNRVAAFIAEPILASGGVIVPPAGYHKRCFDICRKYDVLYISDEVVTGFGRLGHWFASKDVYGITPDIITCAKGMTSGYVPMGACIISDRLVDEISGASAKGAIFSNGYTYSGHPVAAAAGLKNMEIIEREGILEHVRAVTPHFQERMRALADLPIVGDVRGEGLMGCVECVADRVSRNPLALDKEVGTRIDAHCQELGLIVRPLINMCVFSPPLIITADEIDRMFDILAEGIRRASDDLAREGLWAA